MEKLKQYIIALTNLYGIVLRDLVVEIYNEQNKDQISMPDLEEYLKNLPEEFKDPFFYSYEDYFVHHTIVELDEFKLILKEKGDKPYYIPKQTELLKYVEETYFEKNKEYKSLLNYVDKNFFGGDAEKSELFCRSIYVLFQLKYEIVQVFEVFSHNDISFEDEEQANEAMQLVMDLSNNIRIWENNGFTPQEIFDKFERPNLKPLPDKPFIIKKEKLGRNDPCLCGSGKKYKKCCLGKEE